VPFSVSRVSPGGDAVMRFNATWKRSESLMADDLYEQWIRTLFDRPNTERPWYWRSDIDIEASDEQKVILIGQTLRRCGVDLTRFTDRQVSDGLNYIFNNSISNTVFLLCQKGVAEELRVDTVRQMKHLYRDCFARRCSPALSHWSESAGPLNGVCYMLWEVSPLTSWKDVVLEVMEDALYVPHDACIESALHGLGRRDSRDRTRVAGIIDRFLAKTKRLRPELRAYAMSARQGLAL
jgi:hypothetical protein